MSRRTLSPRSRATRATQRALSAEWRATRQPTPRNLDRAGYYHEQAYTQWAALATNDRATALHYVRSVRFHQQALRARGEE